MDYLQEGIGLRAIGQRDPLVEYQREGFDMYQAMQDSIKREAVAYVFNAPVEAAEQAEERHQAASQPRTQLSSAITEAEQAAVATALPQQRGTGGKKVGRNQPCPCGSGKKYKNCHGAPTANRA
jgi:preprotein translocase subunit SecA